ncbi:MAG TPA: N-acetylmuramic acid 6-phosphate etherase [Chitinophagaceae bacterium]|nr:N-acetylmuramic acid 6-phosphate etherase [Chitinophagaceae bacterium]
MPFKKITEEPSRYRHLEKMTVAEVIANINKEDFHVAAAVQQSLPQIEKLIKAVVEKMKQGGRLFYIGAGTSGRLGILDASECPPTYGVPKGLVIGVIAGGKKAIINAIEKAEDNSKQGWEDLLAYKINPSDVVVGVASSGTTPYVIGALKKCRQHKIVTGSIACNPGSPISAVADYPVEVIVGPEFVTGSTRMKSGTAQKMVLNMISTTAMIQLGRVEDNKMVNMQLTNNKIINRGIKMILEKTPIKNEAKARKLLLQHGSVKKVIETFR